MELPNIPDAYTAWKETKKNYLTEALILELIDNNKKMGTASISNIDLTAKYPTRSYILDADTEQELRNKGYYLQVNYEDRTIWDISWFWATEPKEK